METIKSFEEVLYRINDDSFGNIALQLYRFQLENNPVYRAFVSHLGRPEARTPEDIPFLPISFFKTQSVRSGRWSPEITFTSSGTTASTTSRHYVRDLNFYLDHSEHVYREFFGPLDQYHFLALLPSYLEREGSSLVAMANHFIRRSGSPHSGFYLHNLEELVGKLERLRKEGKKVVLLAVSFALLDLAEKYPMDLSHCIVMETGGMKGKRRELTRDELHQYLCSRWNIQRIHSEYGMTELLSQGYSLGGGRFRAPSCMKILIRDLNDPFSLQGAGKTGGINVIDLANIHSCAFIETQDLGKLASDGTFEVLGRIDNTDIRGCNLLVE